MVLRRLAMLMVLSLAVPSAGSVAEVSVTDGLLHYKATPGKTSNLVLTETGPGVVEVSTAMGDDDGLKPVGTSCRLVTAVVCEGVTSAAIELGDLGDRLTATYGDRLSPVGL